MLDMIYGKYFARILIFPNNTNLFKLLPFNETYILSYFKEINEFYEDKIIQKLILSKFKKSFRSKFDPKFSWIILIVRLLVLL